MRQLALAAALLLTACTAESRSAPLAQSNGDGRYQMAAVPAGVSVPGAAPGGVPEVWRLDTRTGALEVCYQDGGVKCSPAVLPSKPAG